MVKVDEIKKITCMSIIKLQYEAFHENDKSQEISYYNIFSDIYYRKVSYHATIVYEE